MSQYQSALWSNRIPIDPTMLLSHSVFQIELCLVIFWDGSIAFFLTPWVGRVG